MVIPARIAVLPPGGATLDVRDILIPSPGPYEVIVQQHATGICHSQLDHLAGADPSRPLILGHESSGAVIATGENVDHVAVGDEVLVTWVPRNNSRLPRPVRIPFGDGTEATTRNVYTWATHALADEQYVVKIPKGLPGDLISIVGCAIMTGAGAVINSARASADRSVAVWGVGGVGLAAVAAARNSGASPVIAVDIADDKLALSYRMGAHAALNATQVDAIYEIRKLTTREDGTAGVDYSIDCTGLSSNLPKAVAATRSGVPGTSAGGVAVLVGAIRGSFELSGMELINGQKTLIGCFGGGCSPDRDFPLFLKWFAEGNLDLNALVTTRYSLDQVNEGVEDLRAGRIAGRGIIEL